MNHEEIRKMLDTRHHLVSQMYDIKAQIQILDEQLVQIVPKTMTKPNLGRIAREVYR